MDNKITKIEVTHKTIIFTVLFLIGLYLLFLIKDIIILFVIALLLMTALNPMVTRLEKFKIPRGLSIAITYIIFYGVLITSVAMLVPPLTHEFIGLIQQVTIPPQILQSLDINSLNLQDLEVIANQFSSVPKILDIIFSAFTLVFVIFTVSVISFYLLVQRKDLHKSLVWLFGNHQSEKKAERFINKLENQIGSWVRGETALMLIVGVLTYIGLSLLGVNYALPLSIIAGMLELLPNVGPVLSAVPAVILAYFSMSPTTAIIVALLYTAIQQLENYLIVPIVMNKNVGLSPVTTILTLLIGYRLGGIIGAVLSIPVFLVLKVIVSEIYKLQQEK